MLLLLLCDSRSNNREGNAVWQPSLLLRDLSMRLLAQGSYRCVGWTADGIAGYEKFHSPVLLPSGRAFIRGYWRGATKPFCTNGVCCHTLLHQVIPYRSRAILRELLIHFGAANIVGVTANLNIESRVREQNPGDLCQLLPRVRLQGVLSSVEQDIRHADNESASAVARLEDIVQLFGQSCTHGRFIVLRLMCILLRLCCS